MRIVALLALLVPPGYAAWYDGFLPECECKNFRNGLTTDHVGEMACARSETHGIKGTERWCAMPDPGSNYVPLYDDGCPVDMYRCIVAYMPPAFPSCSCTVMAHDGIDTPGHFVCQKGDTCAARNYEMDKKIGGSEDYGCPIDMMPCTISTHPEVPDELEALVRTLFDATDLDGSGTVSADEILEYEVAFRFEEEFGDDFPLMIAQWFADEISTYDVDGDGEMSGEEIQQSLMDDADEGEELDGDEGQSVVASADSDGSGTLTFDELLAFLTEVEKNEIRDELRDDGFAQAMLGTEDTNGDGELSWLEADLYLVFLYRDYLDSEYYYGDGKGKGEGEGEGEGPTAAPTVSSAPSAAPSAARTVSSAPSAAPTVSSAPSAAPSAAPHQDQGNDRQRNRRMLARTKLHWVKKLPAHKVWTGDVAALLKNAITQKGKHK